MRDIDKKLLEAVIYNNFQKTKLLLENGANPNVQDHGGLTPLHWASHNKNLIIIKFLIENKADLNITNNLGHSPLTFSIVNHGDKDTISFLLENGANPNLNKNKIPLFLAIKLIDYETVKLLIKYGADLNIQNNWISPLFLVLSILPSNINELSESEFEKFTKNKGINLTSFFNKDINVLKKENNKIIIEIAKLLLENGANPNIKNKDGKSFIELCNNEEILQIIKNLENFVKCESSNRTGRQKFRKKIIEKYKECIFTGISNESLLIASHIKPWSICNDDEKNDINNGLLLSTKYDELFDKGLITFDEEGKLLINSFLSKQEKQELNLQQGNCYKEKLQMNDNQKKYLEYHKNNIFNKNQQKQKIVNLESQIQKKKMQKMFCSEKEKTNLNLEINNMLKEVQNLKINFDLLEINSIDLQNQPSTSECKPYQETKNKKDDHDSDKDDNSKQETKEFAGFPRRFLLKSESSSGSTSNLKKTEVKDSGYNQKKSNNAMGLNEQLFDNIGMKYVLNIKNELDPKYNVKKCESILVSKLKNENKYDLLNKAQTGLENNENLTPYEIESKNEWIQKTKNKIKKDYQDFMKSKNIKPDILKKELIFDKNKISNLNIQKINSQEQFHESQAGTSSGQRYGFDPKYDESEKLAKQLQKQYFSLDSKSEEQQCSRYTYKPSSPQM